MRIEDDFRAWYELMRRFNHMFNLGVDLSELERKSDELTGALDTKVDELVRKMPQLKIREYLKEIMTILLKCPLCRWTTFGSANWAIFLMSWIWIAIEWSGESCEIFIRGW
ncbi:MAG: hypothetical protein R2911_43685 [Caldilineaceae bacterium]